MKKMVTAFIERTFKTWGVELETNLPPEFYVTKHAEQRLKQRVGIKATKIPKFVTKAYYSKHRPIPKLNRKEYRNLTGYPKNRVAREMMGFVFIFAYSTPRGGLPKQKALITVI